MWRVAREGGWNGPAKMATQRRVFTTRVRGIQPARPLPGYGEVFVIVDRNRQPCSNLKYVLLSHLLSKHPLFSKLRLKLATSNLLSATLSNGYPLSILSFPLMLHGAPARTPRHRHARSRRRPRNSHPHPQLPHLQPARHCLKLPHNQLDPQALQLVHCLSLRCQFVHPCQHSRSNRMTFSIRLPFIFSTLTAI